jgi:hypothetical protein
MFYAASGAVMYLGSQIPSCNLHSIFKHSGGRRHLVPVWRVAHLVLRSPW